MKVVIIPRGVVTVTVRVPEVVVSVHTAGVPERAPSPLIDTK